jgi:hypothetical protein
VDDEERLRSLLGLAAGSMDERAAAPLPELLRRAKRHRNRRHRVAAVCGVALTGAVVALPIALVRTQVHRHQASLPPAAAPGTVQSLAHDRWTELPPAPIAGRSSAAAVWTGEQMLIWGGVNGPHLGDLVADGASYTPATRRWQLLPPAPIDARVDMAYVWAGKDLFIWGGLDALVGGLHAPADGALYDPQQRAWLRLPPAPLGPRSYPGALWTGDEVIVFGGQPVPFSADRPLATDLAAYNPSSNRWRTLPPMPPSPKGTIEALTAVAGDHRIYVWQTWLHLVRNGNMETGESGQVLLTYDEASNQWQTLSTLGIGPAFTGPSVLWTGLDLLEPTGGGCGPAVSCPAPPLSGRHGYRLDLSTTTWSAILLGPIDGLNPMSFWTGAALLKFSSTSQGAGSEGTILPGAAAAWDPKRGAWKRLPDAPYAGVDVVAVWAGDRLLVWGDMYRPKALTQTMPPETQTIGLQFGP